MIDESLEILKDKIKNLLEIWEEARYNSNDLSDFMDELSKIIEDCAKK